MISKIYSVWHIALLLLLVGTVECRAQVWDASIDPLDTIDEVDLKTLKAKIPMSRNNVAAVVVKMNDFSQEYGKGQLTKTKFEAKTGIKLDSIQKSASWAELMAMVDTMRVTHAGEINYMDYVVNDRYRPVHQTFLTGLWKNFYVGAGAGMEQVIPQNSAWGPKPFTQLSILVGKDLDKKNGVRMSFGGGWGYMNETEKQIMRLSLRADYLFNLSTHFDGYNPSRSVELLMMGGAGLHYTGLKNYGTRMSPEAHFGFQLRFFTGPKGYFNVEPYAGIGGDQLDLSGSRNWKGYDIFWGINANYAFYLKEHLSPESKLMLLRKRMANDRVISADVIDSWRTPWFVEAAAGVAFLQSEYLSAGSTMGNDLRISVGRWFSPLVGAKFSLQTRDMKWKQFTVEGTSSLEEYSYTYPIQYLSMRLDLMFNPLAFKKGFQWDAPWGVYTMAGMEYGILRRWDDKGMNMKTHSEAYSGALHVWYKLTPDMHVFLEPRYSYNIYSVPYNNVDMRQRHTEGTATVEIGLTQLIRSEKFKMLEKFDDVQEYTYRFIRGFRIGAGAGFITFQRHMRDYGGGSFNWNYQGFVEYRFNFLHSVRASVDVLNLSRANMFSYTETGSAPDGWVYSRNGQGLFNVDSKLALCALNYEVSLTNLCSGPLKDRKFELSAFAGPAAALRMSLNLSPAEQTTLHYENSVVTPSYTTTKRLNFGANCGLKLTYEIWKGISAYFTPTVYLMRAKWPELNAFSCLSGAQYQLYTTFSLGIQYKCGKMKFDPATMRRLKAEYMRKWRQKQIDNEKRRELKEQVKQAKRRKEYYDWRERQSQKYYLRKDVIRKSVEAEVLKAHEKDIIK